MVTVNNKGTERRVHVYDPYADNVHDWQFSYKPGVNSAELKNLTKHCNIQEFPDCEFAYTVEVNGKKFYFFEAGDSALILTCILCIMLDNQDLETALFSRTHSQSGTSGDSAKRIIERFTEL